MNTLKKYFTLIQERPEMFINKGDKGEIKIITDENRIRAEQKKIRATFKKEGKPTSWIDIGVLAEDEWFYILRDMVEFPDGRVGGYTRWINRKSEEGGGFNSVLICIQSDKILMIRKFRHEERNWSWEFPRGFGEPGLSAEKNARVELYEEIGVSNAKLTCLTKVKEGKGGTAVFLVEIPNGQKITLETQEGIAKYRWVKMANLEQIVKKGQLSDWFSLWAYTLYEIM
ncbi:MAG: NUDIX domain-containing protein [Anaerolineales bacterium]|nr:NUDIX domain-containing protein [Anaerolineales bacterium]MBX3038113.1 NUDIX domain-containing protein [Anaerolineales bacterium]